MVDLSDYYSQQAGTGVAFYPGIRYQRGHGFFGRFFKGNLLPMLQSLGHKLLSTGVDVADDVINNDIDPMESLKTRGKAAAKGAVNEMITTAKSKLAKMNQKGSGIRKYAAGDSIKSIKGGSKKKKRIISKKATVEKASKNPSMNLKKVLKKRSKRRSKKSSRKTARKTSRKKVTKKKQRKGKRKSSKRVSRRRALPQFLEV